MVVEICGKTFGWDRKHGVADAAKQHCARKETVDVITPAMQACSGCAGDYEDPDRTVWVENGAEHDAEDETEGDAKEERRPRAEQIPVQEE